LTSIRKFQKRRDTTANWALANPVLLAGEVGRDTDAKKDKTGDGTTAWNSLPYDQDSPNAQYAGILPDTNAEGIKGTNAAKAITSFQALRLSQVGGQGDLPRLRKAIWDSRYAGPKHVRITRWGDSVGSEFMGVRATCSIWRELGFGGFWFEPQGSNGVFFYSDVTGTTSFNTSDFDVKPNGYTLTLGSGGTWTVFQYTAYDQDFPVADMLWNTVTVCYVVEPGAGTFKIGYREGSELAFVDAQTGINASGALGFGSVTISVPRVANTQIKLTQTSGGNVRILGILAVDSTTSGAIITNFTQGGINVTQVNDNGSQAVYSGLMATLKPCVVTWSAKDDLSMLQSGFAGFVTKMTTGWPHFDWAFVQSCPGDGSSLFTEAESADMQFIRNYAVTNGHYCFDARNFARTWDGGNVGMEPAKTITTLTRSGTTATVTLAGHGYVSGDYVKITGASDANFNQKTVGIAVINSSTFAYPVANTGATSATGASVQKTAAVNNDGAHLSATGRDTYAGMVLRDMGLIDNLVTKVSRDVKALVVDSTDYRVKGLSIVRDSQSAIEETWKRTRGLATASGIWTAKTGIPVVGTGDFTIATHVWVRAAANWGSDRLGNLQDFSNSSKGIAAYRSSTNQIRVGITTAAAGLDKNLVFDEASIVDTIACLALVRSSGVVKAYLNGLLLSILDNGGGGSASYADSIDSQYYLANGTGVLATSPVLMESAFWNSALTALQLYSYYKTKVAPGSPSLLWRYRQNSGNIIPDESGNNNHGEMFSNFNNNQNPTYKWNAATGAAVLMNRTTGTVLPVNQPVVSFHTGSLVTWSLPPTPSIGDVVEVIGSGSGGWRITQPANHQIREGAGGTIGTNATTVGTGGRIASTNRYDSVKLMCVSPDYETSTDYRWVILRKNGTLAWV
jgi:hypothetical protein